MDNSINSQITGLGETPYGLLKCKILDLNCNFKNLTISIHLSFLGMPFLKYQSPTDEDFLFPNLLLALFGHCMTDEEHQYFKNSDHIGKMILVSLDNVNDKNSESRIVIGNFYPCKWILGKKFCHTPNYFIAKKFVKNQKSNIQKGYV